MKPIKDLLYRLYENKLLSEVKSTTPPRHVGLILDGNRRFAIERRLKTITEGHKKGADKLDEVLSWCDELKISNITVWVFSTNNISRPRREVKELLQVIETKIQQLSRDPLTHKRRMRIKAIGKMELLPESTRKVIKEAEEITRDYDNLSLNIAVGYGGREEIADALKDLMQVFGKERSLVVARELTKMHEEFFHGTVDDAIAHFSRKPVKGEIVLILPPGSEGPQMNARDALRKLLGDSSLSRRDAVKMVAREYGLPVSDVYRESLSLTAEDREV